MCMKYRAICFDFDYTLGDSTDSIVAGFQYGFTRLGWPAPDRETVRRTVGYLLEDAYTLLTGDRDPEHRAAFRPLFLEASMERQRRETTLFPGAPELLRELKARGIRLGIVSTKRSDTLEAILENRGVLGAAMSRLGAGPEETLFCGDTVLDAGAAQNAGTEFAAVLNGTTPASAFREWPHVHIAPDLWDLKRWLEEQ